MTRESHYLFPPGVMPFIKLNHFGFIFQGCSPELMAYTVVPPPRRGFRAQPPQPLALRAAESRAGVTPSTAARPPPPPQTPPSPPSPPSQGAARTAPQSLYRQSESTRVFLKRKHSKPSPVMSSTSHRLEQTHKHQLSHSADFICGMTKVKKSQQKAKID